MLAGYSARPPRAPEHQKKESVIRKVYDEETGRVRLVKGSGEIIERIVTREQHLAINHQATHHPIKARRIE
eukprot:tig00000624_g2641.t1